MVVDSGLDDWEPRGRSEAIGRNDGGGKGEGSDVFPYLQAQLQPPPISFFSNSFPFFSIL